MNKHRAISIWKIDLLEIGLNAIFLFFFFGSLNVSWGQDWTEVEARYKSVHPYAASAFLVVFYGNAYVLIPIVLAARKWGRYLVGLTSLILLIEIVRAILFISITAGISYGNLLLHFRQELFRFGVFGIQEGVSLGLFFSWTIGFTRGWLRGVFLIERLRLEKSTVELAFLKSQIDPHFLFNTLNSIYALALEEKGNRTADSIARLGGLMRYSLEDTRENVIPLQKELDYLSNYIALQKLRLTEFTQVNCQIDVFDGSRLLAPLLMIPLVENAFKYGVSPNHPTKIELQIRQVENLLIVDVQNTIIANQKVVSSGMGLKNLQNRLTLLYPGQHQLETGPQGDLYIAHLEINLTP